MLRPVTRRLDRVKRAAVAAAGDLRPFRFRGLRTLRFLPDPAFDGQSENDVEADPDQSDNERLRTFFEVLATHTRTPEDCYFCGWEGYGDVYGGAAVSVIVASEDIDPRPGPTVTPAFPPQPTVFPVPPPVLDGPRVVVPHRAYFMFHGPLYEAGDWGAGETWPGRPSHLKWPAFAWPADHAWCVASDVDPHWAGIGADTLVIDQLVADPRLDVVPADPSKEQPAYR
jgi:hypothetical protein